MTPKIIHLIKAWGALRMTLGSRLRKTKTSEEHAPGRMTAHRQVLAAAVAAQSSLDHLRMDDASIGIAMREAV